MKRPRPRADVRLEQTMDESRNANGSGWIIVSGAVLGGLAFYLLQTPKGRQLCDILVRALDEFSLECRRVSQAASRAEIAAAEAWQAINLPRTGYRSQG
jgi:hypothetical protein